MFKILRKNIIVFVALLMFVLSSITYAENLDRSEDSKKLSAITPRFCNNNTVTRDLDLWLVNTNEDIDICVGVLNSYEKNVKIKMYFTDAVKPKDGSDKYTCKLEESEKIAFGKYAYFTDESLERKSSLTYEMQKDETFFTKAIFNLPASYQGKLKGCLVTEIADFEEIPGYLNVKVRKANLITLSANWEIKIALNIAPWEVIENKNNLNSNFLASILGTLNKAEVESLGSKVINYNDNIVIKKDEKTGDLFAQMKMENSGGVPLEITLDSKIKNIFGFKKELTRKEVLNVQENKLIRFDIEKLPFYGGNYDLIINVKSEAIIDEEIKNKIDKSQQNIEEESYELGFYIFPTKIVLGLIVFVLGVILIFTVWKQRGKNNII